MSSLPDDMEKPQPFWYIWFGGSYIGHDGALYMWHQKTFEKNDCEK